MMNERSFLHQLDLILCWTTAVLVFANVFGADISWYLIALCSILNMLVLRYATKPRKPTR